MFASFKAYWPRKFKSIWKTADEVAESKRAFLQAFRECDYLTPETLEIGLQRARKQPWPVDNPGEFLLMCRPQPEDVGAPPVDEAFKEACRMAHPCASWSRWSHKCVYWAATWTGLSDLHERGNQLRDRFAREYALAVEKHSQLKEAPRAALPSRVSGGRTEAEELAAEQGIARCKAILRGHDESEGGTHENQDA